MFHPWRRPALTPGVQFRAALLLVVLVFAFTGCSDDEDEGLAKREDLRSLFQLEAIAEVPYPPDNPPIAERIELGRQLFFDPILSGQGDVSCGTCHHPAFAWGDGSDFSVGVSGEVAGLGSAGVGPERTITEPTFFLTTPRNSPTIINSACLGVEGGEPHFRGRMFWDGRADGLEDQAKLPIASFDEMRGFAYAPSEAIDRVLDKLRDIPEYVSLFRAAFPEEAEEMDRFPERHVIREDTYGRAIAAYERELVADDSPFDRYVKGDDWALTDEQFEGMRLFFEKAECGSCHHGPMLSSFEFTVTGKAQAGPGRVAASRGGDGLDHGREEHTDDPFDEFAFRVPPLRNVEITAPYFRTGAAKTLREVVEFYNDGGNDSDPKLEDWRIDPRIKPLNLTDEEIDLIVEFLKSLTDRTIKSSLVDLTVPLTVPSGLDPPVNLAPFSRVPGPGE